MLLIIGSCVETQDNKVNYHIINGSNHKINLIYYNDELIDSSKMLFYSDSINSIYFGDQGNNLPSPPPFSADSVCVVFDDSIKIVHYRIQNQGINRNIFEEDSWILEIISEHEYKYDYIFTEGDYLEAKER